MCAMYLNSVPIRMGTCKVLKRIPKSNEIFNRITRSVSTVDPNKSKKSDVKIKLRELKVPFQEGYTCLKVNKCTYCSTPDKPSANGALYVNNTTGSFLCHSCQMSGDWETLINIICSKSLNKDNILDIKKDCFKYYLTEKRWSSVLDSSVALSSMKPGVIDEIMESFNLMKCPKNIVESLCIRVQKNGEHVIFPITLMNVIVGYLILDRLGKMTTFPRANCPNFLSYSRRQSHVSAIAVFNVHDFIALVSQNLEHEIICLPYGMLNLPPNSLPKFECFKKIIFWPEPKYAVLNSCHQFARKLGEKRCYLIKPKTPQLSPFKAVKNCEPLTDIINCARPVWHKFVTDYSSLKDDIMTEIVNMEELTGVGWTRYAKLNDILKGHRRGELTIVTGATGSGKTTFLSEYSLDLAINGVNTLWGSFEVKNTRLVRIMLQQFARKSFSSENLQEFEYFSSEFEKLPIYFLSFHGQRNIGTVMKAVEHSSYVYDIAHLIIDNVQFMIDVSFSSNISDRFWIQDNIIQTFRRFATANNCHVTLVVHPRKESDGLYLHMNSIFGSAKTCQEADNVLIIQQMMNPSTGLETKKHLQVCKNRFAGDLGNIPLEFDKKSFTLSKRECKYSKPPAESHKEECHYEPKQVRQSIN